jgi:hypothetical protein
VSNEDITAADGDIKKILVKGMDPHKNVRFSNTNRESHHLKKKTKKGASQDEPSAILSLGTKGVIAETMVVLQDGWILGFTVLLDEALKSGSIKFGVQVVTNGSVAAKSVNAIVMNGAAGKGSMVRFQEGELTVFGGSILQFFVANVDDGVDIKPDKNSTSLMVNVAQNFFG